MNEAETRSLQNWLAVMKLLARLTKTDELDNAIRETERLISHLVIAETCRGQE